MLDDINSFLKMMKFTVNHPYKMQHFHQGFFMGLANYLGNVSIELANVCVLLTTGDTLSLIGNFVSLVVISQFDNFVYLSMSDDPCKVLITDDFTSKVIAIQHTTSKKAHSDELTEIEDENGDMRPLRVAFMKRNCINKFYFIIYKICRIFYVSVYFYYLPAIAIALGASVTVLFRDIDWNCNDF